MIQLEKTIDSGYVHDQGAAMRGGMSGHAGLSLSNTNDIAKMMQCIFRRVLMEETCCKNIDKFNASLCEVMAWWFDKPD
jgi:hypothetical protein